MWSLSENMCWNMKCYWMFYEQLKFQSEKKGALFIATNIFFTTKERERATHYNHMGNKGQPEEPISINACQKE